MTDRFIDSPPEGLEGWRAVWSGDLEYRRPPLSPLKRLVLSVFGPVLDRWFRSRLQRQRNFNIALLEMITDLRTDLAAVRAEIISREASVRDHVGTVTGVAVRRNDALLAALDQKIEAFAVRARDLSNELLARPGVTEAEREDFLYRRLEDGLRGSEAEIREAMEDYVRLAEAHQPVLDIGCGRGEFLRLCSARGIAARGFDTNERSVADLRQMGLDAAVAGIPKCFEGIDEGSIGSILASHVVEHLPVATLFSLFTEASRVLRDDGLLMIETPNAESLAVSGSDFWRDPTHLAPRHVAALVLIGRELQFEVAEARTIHPHPSASLLTIGDEQPADLKILVERLKGVLFGDQSLRLVLRKRGR
ncbi:MAG TPA: methyltransferase domain-containing protein [Thermoanaerobaculia bacterium]|nr:methyltransferase domain-containing protein [Thermoanaerobaculia bacterium]